MPSMCRQTACCKVTGALSSATIFTPQAIVLGVCPSLATKTIAYVSHTTTEVMDQPRRTGTADVAFQIGRKEVVDRTMESLCWHVACATGDTTANSGFHRVYGRLAWDQLGAGERAGQHA